MIKKELNGSKTEMVGILLLMGIGREDAWKTVDYIWEKILRKRKIIEFRKW